MKTLEDYLKMDAELYPNKVAVVCGNETCTYRQLWHRVSLRAKELHSKGMVVPFLASQTIDFLVEYFAIHLAGLVAVPLEKVMDIPSCPLPSDAADVLFTTGTTGKSKGVIISHTTIIANAENLIEAQGYHHDLTFIINGPLNHIGSLSKIYPVILVGGTLYILEGMKDLNAFYEVMDMDKKYATFLVPASIRMLLTFSADRLANYADRLEFIETGAAPISQADMQKLCEVLPKSRLYNTYASTETGIISTYDFNHGECVAGCLGNPMKNSRFFIVNGRGEKERQAHAIGKVACMGKTLMSGYYGDELLTQAILREGVLYTSDLAKIDDEGRLRLQGRDGDVINVGGYKVSPTEVEDAALSLVCIKDCVCIPVEHRVLGTILKLLVVLHAGYSLDKRQLALALREKLEPYKVPMQYEQVDAIKRTFNGKIDRKKYL